MHCTSVLWQKGVFKESVQCKSLENLRIQGSSPLPCSTNGSSATISPKSGKEEKTLLLLKQIETQSGSMGPGLTVRRHGLIPSHASSLQQNVHHTNTLKFSFFIYIMGMYWLSSIKHQDPQKTATQVLIIVKNTILS